MTSKNNQGSYAARARLTEGPVAAGLIRLAAPMVLGMLGMVIFNLTDTFFVGQLGPEQLAALSFTFPVVMVLNALAQGVGLSSSALVSRAVGEGNHYKVKRLATDSLLLGVTVLVGIIAVGQLTIRPLFSTLGAEGVILDYIESYMRIWYFGSVMVVIPMIGNNIIRGLGDTKTPGMVMAISASMNVVLDPLLIFGLGPFPELGIQGAAAATVMARSITAAVSLSVLSFRERILLWALPSVRELWGSWRQLLYIAAPNALINMTLPLGSGVVTRILASFGPSVVAGFGVATRVEMLALVAMGALASVSGPFAGQNLGAGKLKRVRLGLQTGELLCVGIGLLLAVVLGVGARRIAGVFSSETAVVETTVLYLRIVPAAYGFQGILRLGATVLNVFQRPFHSSGLTLLQTFGIYIPLAFAASLFVGLAGIFASLALSYFIAGLLAHTIVHRQIIAAAGTLSADAAKASKPAAAP